MDIRARIKSPWEMSGRLGATGNLVGNAQSVQFAQIFTVNGVEYGFDIPVGGIKIAHI